VSLVLVIFLSSSSHLLHFSTLLLSSSAFFSLLLFFFFFYSYGAHRDLHSFPTRRSSDLLFTQKFHRVRSRRQVHRLIICRHALRSEEHTSELQSHLNLVCRLLLEKKKNKE